MVLKEAACMWLQDRNIGERWWWWWGGGCGGSGVGGETTLGEKDIILKP